MVPMRVMKARFDVNTKHFTCSQTTTCNYVSKGGSASSCQKFGTALYVEFRWLWFCNPHGPKTISGKENNGPKRWTCYPDPDQIKEQVS